MSGPFVSRGIWREEYKHNLQIRHVAASTPRVNQGVQPWVSQRPLAIRFLASVNADSFYASPPCAEHSTSIASIYRKWEGKSY